MTFEKRFQLGLKWEKEVKKRLESLGFLVNEYGQGAQLEPTFQDAIRFMNYNMTAKFIRYLPDWVVAIKNKLCFLIEAKSEMRTDTENYSYELASYDIGMKLHSINVDVIVIFLEWRADFVYNLRFHKKFNDSSLLSHIKGSRTPFGLVYKSTVPTFDDFFDEILNKKEKYSDIEKI
jgi:hypothetical protein